MRHASIVTTVPYVVVCAVAYTLQAIASGLDPPQAYQTVQAYVQGMQVRGWVGGWVGTKRGARVQRPRAASGGFHRALQRRLAAS